MVDAIESVVMLELEFTIVNVHMWTIVDSHSSAPVVWTCTDWSDHRLAFRLHSPASLKEMYAERTTLVPITTRSLQMAPMLNNLASRANGIPLVHYATGSLLEQLLYESMSQLYYSY